jgi:osmotically inducible lipoprotein OsmB
MEKNSAPDHEPPSGSAVIQSDGGGDIASVRRIRGEKNMRNLAVILSGAALLALAACGDSPMERGLSGAGIGAGVGAAGSALTGGSVLGGAAIGGVVGGAAGALTDEDTIDLDGGK